MLNAFLRFFGFLKEPDIERSDDRPIPQLEGTDGLIEADSVIGRENDKIALVIDFELGDVPSWVEWDVDLKQVSIAQIGGAVAILKTKLEEKEAADFKSTDNLFLCSNVDGARVIHKIPLLLRRANSNNDDDMVEFGQELAV